MRNVDKKKCPAVITNWIQLRESAEQSITYEEFSGKKELNVILQEEQKHICCYCQQVIDHFQDKNKGGSHNEHLVPQKGVLGDASLQMEYTNIFACCNYSKGLKPNQQYCGEAKGDKKIRAVIQEQNCSEYFSYNNLGEILPAGEASNYEQLIKDDSMLNDIQKEILSTIKTLNLNCTYLVAERKKVLTSLFTALTSLSEDKIKEKIEKFESQDRQYPFIDMLLFYMKKKVA